MAAGSPAPRSRGIAHADADHAAELLAAIEPEVDSRLLVTDGVFSMDGDLAPLPELARYARAANAWLVVDDAHGLGVVGASGPRQLRALRSFVPMTCPC